MVARLLKTYPPAGASDDSRKVTQWVYGMIVQYGMNPEVGHLSFDLNQNPYLKPFSEQTSHLIDSEVIF